MPQPNNGTAASALLRQKDRTEEATAVIDRDPEEAAAKLAPILKASPNVGEITQADMFQLMSQMQAQMAGMQAQIIELVSGNLSGATNGGKKTNADTQAELANDRKQREMTLESWKTEPREPVFLNPDQDEDKIHAVTGLYPPRVMRINGLEYPISVGEIANVPSSVARLVEYTQRRRPMSGAPQGLPLIPDPQRSQFLAGSQSVTVGSPGRAGEGRLIPDGLPPRPQELGVRYDHNGQ